MRHIFIGDIHGCYAELLDLLDAVGPASDDRIIALGDIVDRGPDSLKVLEFFRDTPNASSIMGNHERKHIRSARGELRPALSQMIVRSQLGESYGEWLAFMEAFPRHLELPGAILVHGFLEPGVPLEEQKDTVVIGTLTGEKYMEKNYPVPWYDHHAGDKPLVVGHHSYLRNGEPVVREGRLYGIDTGCCHGGVGRLTALILPAFEIVSVPSRGDHWSEQKLAHASLADPRRSDMNLDWERLGSLTWAVDRPDLPAKVRERTRRCAEINSECERLVDAVLQTVTGLSESFVAELATAADWEQCSEKKRAGRYARMVANHPASALLFAARSKKLNEQMVRKVCKTPARLLALAEELEIETFFEIGEPETRQPLRKTP